MEVILVGVVHRDPGGYGKLLRLLEDERPEAMGVELSPFGLIWREKKKEALLAKLGELLEGLGPEPRKHPRVGLIQEALGLPFEYRACLEHSIRWGVPLHLLDLNWVSREQLPLYEKEVLTAENISTLVRLEEKSLENQIRGAYRRAFRCLRGDISLKEAGLSPPWKGIRGLRRELHLVCRIRKMARLYGSFLYVGGWVHLVDEPQGLSLARLLEDLHPKKVLLGREQDAGKDAER